MMGGGRIVTVFHDLLNNNSRIDHLRRRDAWCVGSIVVSHPTNGIGLTKSFAHKDGGLNGGENGGENGGGGLQTQM